jgi:hypothetical protein
MVEQLNANYGELAVLVLDQFEELIRHQRPFFKRAMDWVVELNSRYDIHVVISLRSEYVHRLKALNAQIRPFSMSTFELEALTAAEHIRDVMASGNPSHFGSTASLRTEDAVPDPAALAITLEAVELLVGEWNTIQETEFGSADVGLLHLQGALYALHARAAPGGTAIRAEHVRQMIAAAAERTGDIFTLGLIESVARKLDLCEEACLDEDPAGSLDEFLIAGTREAVRRTAAHLSSGGFKLDREAWDLAELALERELRILSDIEPRVPSICSACRALRSRSRPACARRSTRFRTRRWPSSGWWCRRGRPIPTACQPARCSVTRRLRSSSRNCVASRSPWSGSPPPR